MTNILDLGANCNRDYIGPAVNSCVDSTVLTELVLREVVGKWLCICSEEVQYNAPHIDFFYWDPRFAKLSAREYGPFKEFAKIRPRQIK